MATKTEAQRLLRQLATQTGHAEKAVAENRIDNAHVHALSAAELATRLAVITGALARGG